jgi:hypothetical protein
MEAILKDSTRKNKKYMVMLTDGVPKKTIHFGQKGASDYTKHKDDKRKANYIARHKSNENWARSGINSAGFWSRHLSWNKPTIIESIKNIEKNFDINIVNDL